MALATGPRAPLPWTSSLIALLILLPSLALWRWPRPRAEGLEQLMTGASLVQSFPATPGRRLPQLWQQHVLPQLHLWTLLVPRLQFLLLNMYRVQPMAIRY